MQQQVKICKALGQAQSQGLFKVCRGTSGPSTVEVLDKTLPVHNVWSQIVQTAARETLKAVKQNSKIDLTLQDLPLSSLQLFVGRTHQIGIEVEGVNYEVSLNSDADLRERAKALPLGQGAAGSADGQAGSSTGLVAHDWWSHSAHHSSLALPEITLSGPVELVLSEASLINMYTPHSVDVGMVRRICIEQGATVRVAGIKGVALRKALDLPRLPGQYLAEVYAQAQLGTTEEGYNNAPGILYMASELKQMAVNHTAHSAKSKAGPAQKARPSSPSYLVSFSLEPAGPGSISITTAPQLAAEGVAPRLKVKKLADGTLEVGVRQGQVASAANTFSIAALTHIWAWPLPHLDMSNWVPYEAVLRSVLAAHPFVLQKVVAEGIAVRLTKSTIKGVNLISFLMEVRAKQQRPADLEGLPYEFNETPLEVWEAIVQVQPKAGSAGEFEFVPLHVRRKASYQNTLTVSETALRSAFHNSTVPMGFETDYALL